MQGRDSEEVIGWVKQSIEAFFFKLFLEQASNICLDNCPFDSWLVMLLNFAVAVAEELGVMLFYVCRSAVAGHKQWRVSLQELVQLVHLLSINVHLNPKSCQYSVDERSLATTADQSIIASIR